jgi:hypothetical protein
MWKHAEQWLVSSHPVRRYRVQTCAYATILLICCCFIVKDAWNHKLCAVDVVDTGSGKQVNPFIYRPSMDVVHKQ